MPTATYKELLLETLPQVIETEAQYHQMARRFGDLVVASTVGENSNASAVRLPVP